MVRFDQRIIIQGHAGIKPVIHGSDPKMVIIRPAEIKQPDLTVVKVLGLFGLKIKDADVLIAVAVG